MNKRIIIIFVVLIIALFVIAPFALSFLGGAGFNASLSGSYSYQGSKVGDANKYQVINDGGSTVDAIDGGLTWTVTYSNIDESTLSVSLTWTFDAVTSSGNVQVDSGSKSYSTDTGVYTWSWTTDSICTSSNPQYIQGSWEFQLTVSLTASATDTNGDTVTSNTWTDHVNWALAEGPGGEISIDASLLALQP